MTCFTHPDRYWWHESVARELRRQRDAGRPAYCVDGIAGNIRGMLPMDVRQYLDQMVEWGEVVKAEPLWDFKPDDWYALALAPEPEPETEVGFYVTVKDGSRTGFLVGPLPTHEEALALVEPTRKIAESLNDRAHWFAFGTARVEGPSPVRRGLLNEYFGLTPRA